MSSVNSVAIPWPSAVSLALLAASLNGWGQQSSAATNRPTPYARQASLAIHRVELASRIIPRYQRTEMAVELSATYDNPFNSTEVALDARIQPPSGKAYQVPGFLYREYQRELRNNSEKLTPAGAPSWRLRFAPFETGPHTMVIVLRDRTGRVESAPLSFEVTASTNAGFVRVSPRDRRYFEFDSGTAFFPIGANVCWAYGRGTFDFDEWLARYSEVGCNFGRLWLAPHWTTFALDRPGKREDGLGLGQFDLANAWRIDHVLALAEQRGLWLKLCIESFNVLREKTSYPQWENTPHNSKNGGPLNRPTDFWHSPDMDRLFRDKLRYLVARYGASTHMFAWEFWNEVDITTGYQTAPARDWHQRMARHLREMDPYRHLITTSFAGTAGDAAIDKLPELDFVQTHHYGSSDIVLTLARAQSTKAAFGKPHYVGEIGADAGGPRERDDPAGLQVHDPLWVSVGTGGSGSAQSWWWDNLIHPRKLYPLFRPLADFVSGIDWPAESFRSVAPRVDWRARPEPLPRVDLLLENGPVSWEKTEANRPRTVRISRAGAEGELPLAGIQHGLGGHRDKHNPVTFETDLPAATRFEVLVGDVSGYGGAALTVSLDGKVVLTNAFPDPDSSTKTLTQYAGAYGLELPAGRHTLVVENTGADWFLARYRFRDAVDQQRPPLLAWALAGKNTALAWLRVEGRSWQRVCALKESVPPAPPSWLHLPGLAEGQWQVELWDTWKTAPPLAVSKLTVDKSGAARLELPAITHDLAVKLRRLP